MSVCLSFSNLANAPWSLVRSHHLKRMRLALACYKLERNVILGVNSIKKQLTNICQRPNSPTNILEITVVETASRFLLWSVYVSVVNKTQVSEGSHATFFPFSPSSLPPFFLPFRSLSLSLSLSPFRFPFRLYDVLPNK